MSKLADVISTGESCNPKQFNEIYSQTDKGWISISDLFKAQDEKMLRLIDILQGITCMIDFKDKESERIFEGLYKELGQLSQELE